MLAILQHKQKRCSPIVKLMLSVSANQLSVTTSHSDPISTG